MKGFSDLGFLIRYGGDQNGCFVHGLYCQRKNVGNLKTRRIGRSYFDIQVTRITLLGCTTEGLGFRIKN